MKHSVRVIVAVLALAAPVFAERSELPATGLESRIDFWKKIFTQYGKNDIVLHDRFYVNLVYDVAHNIAKIETYQGDNKAQKLLVHRKGATRAFGPGNPALSNIFRQTGQPVLVGGSMQTGSYLLVGTKMAEELTFGSTCHGAGRVMSRAAAKKKVHGSDLLRQMESEGIYVRTASFTGLAEEAGFAYKNVSDVVDAVHGLGISKKVARFIPLANIKG